MGKIPKMTAEDEARYQANIDRLRELLIKNGGKPPEPRPQAKS